MTLTEAPAAVAKRGLGARELAGQPALAHHENAVGHAEHLGQFGA